MENNQIAVISVSELKNIIFDILTDHLKSTTERSAQYEDKSFITREEVAKKLRISLPTLNTLTKANALKGYRIGRRVLYKLNEIESCLTEISSIKYKHNTKN